MAKRSPARTRRETAPDLACALMNELAARIYADQYGISCDVARTCLQTMEQSTSAQDNRVFERFLTAGWYALAHRLGLLPEAFAEWWDAYDDPYAYPQRAHLERIQAALAA
ncbi:MAG: hypothetical protein QM736_20530 [Vicinamibacterales bacterium]